MDNRDDPEMKTAFVFDAWAGKSEKELKADCRRLNRTAHRFMHMALSLAEHSPAAIEALPVEWREELACYMRAYSDTDE